MSKFTVSLSILHEEQSIGLVLHQAPEWPIKRFSPALLSRSSEFTEEFLNALGLPGEIADGDYLTQYPVTFPQLTKTWFSLSDLFSDRNSID
jgi:hypothetical protein